MINVLKEVTDEQCDRVIYADEAPGFSRGVSSAGLGYLENTLLLLVCKLSGTYGLIPSH